MSIAYRNAERYPDPTAFQALTNIENEEKAQRRFMPLVYICSPYAGDTENNAAAARRYCRFAVDRGCIPFAPHLLYPQFLNDRDPADRSNGLFFGKILMDKCSAVWVFGNHISSGMSEEIERAKRKGYPIRYFSADLEEQNEPCI